MRSCDGIHDSNWAVLDWTSADSESMRMRRFNLEMALSGRPPTLPGRPLNPLAAVSNPTGGKPSTLLRQPHRLELIDPQVIAVIRRWKLRGWIAGETGRRAVAELGELSLVRYRPAAEARSGVGGSRPLLGQ